MRTLLLLLSLLSPTAAHAETATAILAGGCFWCVEADFEKLDGLIEAVSGYTGGSEKNPTYEQVSDAKTGHVEAVRIRFDAAKLSYRHVLQYYWRHIDPLTANAQFCDKGPQYRTAIFYLDDMQKQAALATKADIERSGRFKTPVVTEILPAGEFWVAENYHQDYYKKNPLRYRYYRHACGRDARVEELWGKPG